MFYIDLNITTYSRSFTIVYISYMYLTYVYINNIDTNRVFWLCLISLIIYNFSNDNFILNTLDKV